MTNFEFNADGFFNFATANIVDRMAATDTARAAYRDAKQAELHTLIALAYSAVAGVEGWGSADGKSVALKTSEARFDRWRKSLDKGKTDMARVRNARLCLLGLYRGSPKVKKAFIAASAGSDVVEAVELIRVALPATMDSINKLATKYTAAKNKAKDDKAKAAAAAMEGEADTETADPTERAAAAGDARKAADKAAATMADDMAALVAKWKSKGMSLQEVSDARDVFNAFADGMVEAYADAARDVTPVVPRIAA